MDASIPSLSFRSLQPLGTLQGYHLASRSPPHEALRQWGQWAFDVKSVCDILKAGG